MKEQKTKHAKANKFLVFAIIGVLIFLIGVFSNRIGVLGQSVENVETTPVITTRSTPSPTYIQLPTAIPTYQLAPKQQATIPVNENDPNRIIKCSISATCGGGLKEMSASECEKITCCQINNQWIVTSKDNCTQSQKNISFEACKASWEKYREDTMKLCNIGSDLNPQLSASCSEKAGETANSEIEKCKSQ